MARERAGLYWALAAVALAAGIAGAVSAAGGGMLPLAVALMLVAALLVAVALRAGRPSLSPPGPSLIVLLVGGGVLFVLFAFTLIGVAGEVLVLLAALGLLARGVSALVRR
jgi:hypothetical protein